jgi:hypothetical protein
MPHEVVASMHINPAVVDVVGVRNSGGAPVGFGGSPSDQPLMADR